MLEVISDLASIATALIAMAASGLYLVDKRKKLRRLESYLKEQKTKPLGSADQGQRTLLHLVANLGMTEGEVMDASFRRKKIRRLVGQDARGYASHLLLEYYEVPKEKG
ncbi:hypothetical protein [Devosia sp. SL43]|uniref:hypothetical protein n=1 Tax=Devosia sp. SL43 TaxID=2806348 RepID=UPI001F4816B2|nr:hypothetical protein [Devosia sp. SL43]UJW86208.1 hypothetical protein IM737_02700 [Devosia sp. SL43]